MGILSTSFKFGKSKYNLNIVLVEKKFSIHCIVPMNIDEF